MRKRLREWRAGRAASPSDADFVHDGIVILGVMLSKEDVASVERAANDLSSTGCLLTDLAKFIIAEVQRLDARQKRRSA
jgi:hypothetical protein